MCRAPRPSTASSTTARRTHRLTSRSTRCGSSTARRIGTARSRATLSAVLHLTGPGAAGATDQGWGVTRTGYRWATRHPLGDRDARRPDDVHEQRGRDECQWDGDQHPARCWIPRRPFRRSSNTVTITNTVTLRQPAHADQAGAGRQRRPDQLDAERIVPRRRADPHRASRLLGGVRQPRGDPAARHARTPATSCSRAAVTRGTSRPTSAPTCSRTLCRPVPPRASAWMRTAHRGRAADSRTASTAA